MIQDGADDARSARPAALVVTVVGAAMFVVLATLFVPWDPVPGGPLHLPAPTEVFTDAEIARAESYSRWARVWGWGGLAVNLLVLLVCGLSERGRALVRRLPGPWWLRAVLAVVLVSVAVQLATLPFGVAAHVHRRRNGLSSQGWAGFSRDVATGFGLSVVVTALVVLIVLVAARRWPRAWPAVAGATLGALVIVGSFVYPVLVEPLFNSFEALPPGNLRTRVLALADREGVPVREVLVADASRRTTTLNAYVSGFGGTRRMVLYDNLVEDLPEDQALSVVAHELAHARHRDVLVGSALGGWGVVAGVGVLGLVAGSRRLERRYGRRPLGRPEVVPLLLAVVAVAGLVVSPVQNGISRRIETRADVDALRATGDAAAFVAMQTKLATRSLSDPTPPAWARLWFGSHPTTLQRVAVAQRLAGSAGARAARGLDGVAGVLEQRTDAATEGVDDEGNEGGDAGDEQAVFNGRGPALVAGAAMPGRPGHRCVGVIEHDVLRLVGGRERRVLACRETAVAADHAVRGHPPLVLPRQQEAAVELAVTSSQVSWKMSFSAPPKTKTMATIRAAMPAMSRPYSTAEAPFSSRSRRAASTMRR